MYIHLVQYYCSDMLIICSFIDGKMQERDTSLYEALYPNAPFASHWPAWDDKGSLCNSLEIREMCHMLVMEMVG